MYLTIDQSVKIKYIRDCVAPIILKYIGQRGLIKGIKSIKGDYILLVEFQDHIRIWIFQKELEISQSINN